MGVGGLPPPGEEDEGVAEVVMVMRRMDTRLFVHGEEKFLVAARG